MPFKPLAADDAYPIHARPPAAALAALAALSAVYGPPRPGRKANYCCTASTQAYHRAECGESPVPALPSACDPASVPAGSSGGSSRRGRAPALCAGAGFPAAPPPAAASRPAGFGGFFPVLSWSMAPAVCRQRAPAGKPALPCAAGGLMAVSAAFAPRPMSARIFCCRSSVVEHLIGNEEVECSIHSGSTTVHPSSFGMSAFTPKADIREMIDVAGHLV